MLQTQEAPVSAADRDILRRLAAEVSEIAALPVQQETIRRWKDLNSLRPQRPMVMIDQVPWHEMNVNGELTLQAADPFCRQLETRLRRIIYQWKHMPVDMVVEPELAIAKVIRDSGYGFAVVEERVVGDPQNSVVSHHYTDQITSEADLAKIRTPEISLDREATGRIEEKARRIFDGILSVRMEGVTWHCFAPWDAIVMWRGVENPLFDLAERPEFIHELMSRLTDAYMGRLDQLEAQGLLDRQPLIHCTGAWTDELPKSGADPARLRASDVWTCGMAQIFSSVSPAMHEEFDIRYAKRWFARFGLGYYGCCEPLDQKIDIIRQLPRVRKISMSPWVDVRRGAAAIGRDFVFSRKPSPAVMAGDNFDAAAVEKDLRETAAACAEYGCPLEIIFKDISTVRYQPQRLWDWARIAMDVVGG